MGKDSSFDIVSEADIQSVRNAVDAAKKEFVTRYDFKGSKSSIELKEEKSATEFIVVGDDAYKLGQVLEVLVAKLVRQNVDARFLDQSKTPEPASQGTLRQHIPLKQGLDQETAKKITKMLRDGGFKAKTQIQGDAVRVTSASKDELQAIMAFLRAKPTEPGPGQTKDDVLEVALSFTNYR